MMLKGVTKRVVVVKSADRRLFDEAIFVVSGDAEGGSVSSPDELLREAQRIAASCTRGKLRRRIERIPRPACALIGSAATAAVWILTAIL